MTNARTEAGAVVIGRSLGGPGNGIATPPANRLSFQVTAPEKIVAAFAAAIADAGLPVPHPIIADSVIHRFATNGKRGDLAGWYVLHLNGVPAGSFGCHRAGYTCTWRAEGARDLTHAERLYIAAMRAEHQAQQAREADAKAARALAIWNGAVDARGTLAEAYLRGRCLQLPSEPVLRFVPNLRHPQGQQLPALVALVQSADGASRGVHRTYLDPAGQGKARVEPAKAMLGRCGGGAVRLAEPRDGLVIVGEGIETTLSAMHATGLPGWAALSAGGMESLVLPANVREVIVLADSDERGTTAASNAAQLWTAQGRRVRVAVPPAGYDFNDLLCAPARGIAE